MDISLFLKYFQKYGYLLNEAYKSKYLERYTHNHEEYEIQRKEYHTCCITTVQVLKELLTYNLPTYNYSGITKLHSYCHKIDFNLTPDLNTGIYECHKDDIKQISLSLTISPNQGSLSNLTALKSLLKTYHFIELDFSFDCHSAAIIYNPEIDTCYWINSYGNKTKTVIYKYDVIELFEVLYNIVTYKNMELYNKITHGELSNIDVLNNDMWIKLEFFEILEPTLHNIKIILNMRKEEQFIMKMNTSLEWLARKMQ